MKRIIVHCGEIAEIENIKQLHPVNEIKRAIEIIESDKDEIVYSNSPDFVSAIKYIGLKRKIETEFFLNGVCCGNDIEPIFIDFNRALIMIDELGDTSE